MNILKRIDYKYIVAAVYAVALFMDLLDTTIVNVALPTVGRDLHVGTAGIEWVVTGYLLSLAVFIPVSGWAGDRFGTKRIFLFAFGVFTGASLACSLAPSLPWLVFARIVQGIGGGMLTPVGAAMVYRAFGPEERARTAALITVPAVIAPAAGPIVGGLLMQAYTWRSVFWLNVPIGIIGLTFAGFALVEHREQNAGRFDVTGFVLAAAGLSSLLYALSRAGAAGFADPLVMLLGLVAAAACVAFVFLELRSAQPMLDLRLFRDSLFRSGVSVQLLGFGAQFGTLFLLPLLLQGERGLTPLQSGLTTFPQAVGVIAMVPLASRLYQRIGPRRMSITGLLLGAAATLPLVAVDAHTGLWSIRAFMFLRGCGFALSLTAMQAATFATIQPNQLGRASAIFSVARQVGTSLTVAVLATLLSAGLSAHGTVLGSPAGTAAAIAAFRTPFLASALIAMAGAMLALRIDDRIAWAASRPTARPGDGQPRRNPAGKTAGRAAGVMPACVAEL
jgi:EmrB/QacA subfamily drug resistance transporter